ncbi:MAG: hypothetical protein V2A72_08300 [Candidatus Omnitrophota bacterium]
MEAKAPLATPAGRANLPRYLQASCPEERSDEGPLQREAKMYYLKIIAILLLLSFATSCYAEGLSSLAEAAKAADDAQKTLAAETKIYEAVKKAIENDQIKQGQSQDEIRKLYGEPLVIIQEKNNIEKWVYKPGHATYFDNVKTYLFFDENKSLIKTESHG